MAQIKDCIGKNVKISKNSITIKDDNGKTCGIVRNICSLYDMQPNTQFEYFKKIKQTGLHGKISIKNCIIHEYIFRNIKSKLYNMKYGYFSETEKQKEEETDKLYEQINAHGFEVIECNYV